MDQETIDLFSRIKKCEIIQYPIVNRIMVICADSKLPELVYELTKIGIVPIQVYGGAHPIAAGVKHVVENIVEQIIFYCELHPGREIVDISTHDLCMYPGKKKMKVVEPRETLATAIDIVENRVSHLVKQINGIHFSFNENTGTAKPTTIIPRLEITKNI